VFPQINILYAKFACFRLKKSSNFTQFQYFYTPAKIVLPKHNIINVSNRNVYKKLKTLSHKNVQVSIANLIICWLLCSHVQL